MQVISVSLEPDLVQAIDSVVEQELYASRSELVRAALRKWMANPHTIVSSCKGSPASSVSVPPSFVRFIDRVSNNRSAVIRTAVYEWLGIDPYLKGIEDTAYKLIDGCIGAPMITYRSIRNELNETTSFPEVYRILTGSGWTHESPSRFYPPETATPT